MQKRGEITGSRYKPTNRWPMVSEFKLSVQFILLLLLTYSTGEMYSRLSGAHYTAIWKMGRF